MDVIRAEHYRPQTQSGMDAMSKEKEPTPQDEANARVEAAVKRKRVIRSFPASSFEEALQFARSIYEYGSAQPVRRLSIFDHLGKAPESGPSRQLIVNASKYGLVKGNSASDFLELTPDGITCLNDELPKREVVKAQIRLSIDGIEPFSKLYHKFAGNKLPAKAALVDAITEFDVPADLAGEAVDTFMVNCRYTGLLQILSGAERLVAVDHLLDSLPTSAMAAAAPYQPALGEKPVTTSGLMTSESAQFESICFYVTPIGEEGSEQRKHADLFLGSIIEPALENLGLKVVRADTIEKPGTITRQIIEYLLKARLVIVDLSFHNPNVFYELAIRHAARLPVVQVIRASDRIPFDLSQIRTIKIDTSDIYTLVPRLELYRAEIASQVRRALDDPDSVDNPITTFYPDWRVEFNA